MGLGGSYHAEQATDGQREWNDNQKTEREAPGQEVNHMER